MSSNRQAAWSGERPIFLGLPESGYQDNKATDWMTAWADLEAVAAYKAVKSLYNLANPYLCPVALLDTLAWMVGLSGEYWDTGWSEQVKRDMISNSKWLFDNIGSLDAVKKVLDIQGISYSIWMSKAVTIPFTMPVTLGVSEMRYIIQLPLSVTRASSTWKEVTRTVKNYNPAIIVARVEYQAFTLGFSVLGDAVY